jgi:hypothetical protein
MKAIHIFIIGSLSMLFSCNSSDSKTAKSDKDSYEKTKENLAEKEKKDPKSFLVVSGHDKHNLFGQMVIKGIVTNKATVATYKDVDVQLSFFSKTGTLLENDRETIFEIIGPGQSKSFKTKYFAPKGSDSVAIAILGAKIVE